MRKIVRAFEPFECPYCGQRYEVHEDGVLLHESGSPCSHIDLEVLPVGSRAYEVYFVYDDEDEDDEDGDEEVVFVRVGEQFECPHCGQRYRLDTDTGKVRLVYEGEACGHAWGPFPIGDGVFMVQFLKGS